MNELSIYGIDGFFHNIVKQSGVMNGRYAVLEKGSQDLNLNNLLSRLALPKEGKYPGVFCLPPISELEKLGKHESFQFRLLFLTKSNYTGNNQIKSSDPRTNSSQHTTAQDWNDMKAVALGFMHALEKLQYQILDKFRLSQQATWRFHRISNIQNDNLNGIMAVFSASIGGDCVLEDINTDAIDLNFSTHPLHLQ